MDTNATPRDVFRFEDLVFDIQAYILALLSPSELLPLTLVSRLISSLSTEALYSDVQLIFTLKRYQEGSHGDGALLEELQSSQYAFMKQIITRRNRARYVRRLTWQVCGSASSMFTNLFPLLHNVTHIHLVDAHPTYFSQRSSFLRSYYNLALPSTLILFPRVRSIRFTGTTSLSLIMPILHSPHQLTSLSLDTINPQSVALDLLHWIRIAQLSSLRTLSLRMMCEPVTFVPSGAVQERDGELPLALREVLSALRPSLESVTLGLRERAKVKRNSSLRLAQLAQIVFPVFWQETWPHLKQLKLEGGAFNGSGLGRSMSRLRAVVPKVVVDPTVFSVQRVWYSQTMENF